MVKSRLLKVAGLNEYAVRERIKDVLKNGDPLAVALRAHETGVEIEITSGDEDEKRAGLIIERVEKKIREQLGDHVFGMDEETMEKIVGILLALRNKTLAVAESCTGGLVSHSLTNIPGSSSYFHSSVVAYSNEAKTGILQVPPGTIERFGAVSPETARAMAKGIRKISVTDLGLAITGIAGPGGGTVEKPVGLVYIALAADNDVSMEEHRFSGEREVIKLKTSHAALDMVRRYLLRE